MRSLKILLLLFPLTLSLAGSAFADKCEAFSTFTCAKHSTDQAFISGTHNSSLDVNMLGPGSFVGIHGGSLVGDTVIIAAAFSGTMGGTLTGSNGVTSGFTSLGSFPEQGALGAIENELGTNTLTFGFANLGTSSTATLGITANGIPSGTLLYAIILNSKGQIIDITANSEAALVGKGSPTLTPEPGSLTLLGTGLVGLAGLVRRKIAKG
jgi:PEP-CTERM motif